MSKIEKFVNLIFFLVILALILFAVRIVFGDVLVPREITVKEVPIKQRIARRITEETGTDTAIKQMLKEEDLL